jgi:hypothetical protein
MKEGSLIMNKVLALLVFFSIYIYSTSINAQENSSALQINQTEQTEIIVDIPQEEINRTEQELLENLTKQRSPLYEYKTEKVGTQTDEKVKIGYAENQPVNGTVFKSKGGFYWSNSGSNVTVSVAYGSFSVGITPGKTGSAGYYIESPYINQACKLMIHKDIQVTKYKQYRRVVMGNGAEWEYIGNVYTKIPSKNYISVVKV